MEVMNPFAHERRKGVGKIGEWGSCIFNMKTVWGVIPENNVTLKIVQSKTSWLILECLEWCANEFNWHVLLSYVMKWLWYIVSDGLRVCDTNVDFSVVSCKFEYVVMQQHGLNRCSCSHASDPLVV